MWFNRLDTQTSLNMNTYKMEHENFVAGHGGTSYLEVAMISSISCIACFTRDMYRLSDLSRVIRPGLITDLVFLVLPNIIGVTVLSNNIALLLLMILVTGLVLCLHILRKLGQIHGLTTSTINCINLTDNKQFITNFRSVINLCTAIAILAVDFPVFPRRLAKSETFGFGGMDAGVGFFVVANAIVSSEARGKGSILPVWKQLKKASISSLPLLLLGFGRLFAVKGSDYHEHVTEYGVHWNFFFTLAALRIVLTLVYGILPVKYSAVGAACVVVGHQLLLSSGLSLYIINGLDGAGGRSGYINANREGICSLPGYIAIYMLGVELGRSFFTPRQNIKEWLTAAKNLAVTFSAFTVIMTIFHVAVESVSRRFANAAFVFWVMSLSSLMILECLLADIVIAYVKAHVNVAQHDPNQPDEHSNILSFGDSKKLVQRSSNKKMASSSDRDVKSSEYETSSQQNVVSLNSATCLLDAISFNSLLFFLLANVLTGAVNMCFATIYASDFVAVVTLVIYMFIISFAVVSLRKRNICTKIW